MAHEIATEYLSSLIEMLRSMEMAGIQGVTGRLRQARDRGARIFIAGNGGSAATAMHWANDLGKATKKSGCAPMKPMCLSDNVSWLTALGNDEGYERVFAGQLENFAVPGDVLVVITASGNSPNLVKAVETAKELGVETIGFLGFDGGVLKNKLDHMVWIATEKGKYELVEDVHMIVCHMLTVSLCADRPQTRTAAGSQE